MEQNFKNTADNRKFRDIADYLLHGAPVESLIKFTECGWQVGLTWIDHEDLFIRSISHRILDTKDFEVSGDSVYLKGGLYVTAIRVEF